MLVEKFIEFLKEQDPPFPCGIHKGLLEADGGVISVDKLETFLRDLVNSEFGKFGYHDVDEFYCE